MTQAEPQQSATKGKGKAFYDRAEQVAETGNWDFAIEMYLEGINREPDNMERGHKPLRQVAINRKAQGGKGPSMMDQLKRRPGKDPVQNLVNAEFLLGKDPGSVSYMQQVLKAAEKLDLKEVIHWISLILLEAQRQAKKPHKRILLDIIKAFEHVKDYAMAIQACDMAQGVAPDDGELRDANRRLSAQFTITRGNYEGEQTDFTTRVADMEGQQKLMQQDSMVQDEEYLLQQIKEARQEYLEAPKVAGKINAIVDALLKMENESYENEAIDILSKAHKDTGAYRFKMRVGDVKIRQMTRRFRHLRDEGDPKGAAEQAQRQLAFELDEFTERTANYPTDLAIRFELGRRQFLSGLNDEAIASLQQAQRDPRRSLRARSLIGQAFTQKGWHREAAETFERALEVEMTEENAKELRYFLGDVLERMGELERAQEQYSLVAQMDYNYKDAHQRIEKIRTKLQESGKEG
ncbi:MAG TPA: hypothetical protein VM695_00670 [Phycisphaerae bacterium]|nr:MAG: hypothetical protein E4H17_02640 [Gemmatimonadales bacterium]HUS90319.1 hypothetical protein [Phycisphaerae bacterium]